MFPEYNPKDIEKAAQDKWLKEGRFKSVPDNREKLSQINNIAVCF